MPVTTTPFLLKRVSLTLMKTDGGTEEEYRCALNQAQLTPSTTTAGATGTTYETFAATFDAGRAASSSTGTMDLNGMQNYQDALDLSLLLFENEGENYTFKLLPDDSSGTGTPSPTNIGFTGQVTATPTQIGGTANQYATFTVSLPVIGKPTKLTALTALAGSPGSRFGDGSDHVA